jgi:hypothetical protein
MKEQIGVFLQLLIANRAETKLLMDTRENHTVMCNSYAWHCVHVFENWPQYERFGYAIS